MLQLPHVFHRTTVGRVNWPSSPILKGIKGGADPDALFAGWHYLERQDLAAIRLGWLGIRIGARPGFSPQTDLLEGKLGDALRMVEGNDQLHIGKPCFAGKTCRSEHWSKVMRLIAVEGPFSQGFEVMTAGWISQERCHEQRGVK